ncbi:sigma factor-like helix-turn-helix DNA-binding protein [Streptomyces sp. NBC_00035]|uniref:sigma factor-like helix-turn-helix DNA-binding protein n=1 Tax=Streptomyces sp. NBC_00035 TaxID=2903614 RepID=UPI00324BD36B
MTASTSVVAHGYTMRDLDAFARSVVSNGRTWWPAGDRDDLYAAAWHGIVESLYSTDGKPSRIDLLEAGRTALAEDVRSTMRHHGARRDTTNNGQRYAMYWDWAGRATPSHEAGLVEREALEQILTALTARQREAFTALAATGDYAEAALLLGIADQTFRSLLGRARDSFRGLWHEGELPSGHWGCDRRAGSVRGTVGKGESAVSNLRRRQRTAARKAAA